MILSQRKNISELLNALLILKLLLYVTNWLYLNNQKVNEVEHDLSDLNRLSWQNCSLSRSDPTNSKGWIF